MKTGHFRSPDMIMTPYPVTWSGLNRFAGTGEAGEIIICLLLQRCTTFTYMILSYHFNPASIAYILYLQISCGIHGDSFLKDRING
jgi:hypothetical protein